ncbi:hypothetical protein AB0A77_16465 [Streptomyces varsoviensis]|uniref:hypothetical protein n=1 Tax=Streptomyces varsoviensis TaxID=67373 RepID=UPI00340D45D9
MTIGPTGSTGPTGPGDFPERDSLDGRERRRPAGPDAGPADRTGRTGRTSGADGTGPGGHPGHYEPGSREPGRHESRSYGPGDSGPGRGGRQQRGGRGAAPPPGEGADPMDPVAPGAVPGEGAPPDGGPGAPDKDTGLGPGAQERPPHVPRQSGPDERIPLQGEPPPATLLPQDDRDRLLPHLRHAINGFVDAPRSSVQEIDALYEELTGRLTDLFGERRRALRAAWHDDAAQPQTEELRLVLRDYRDAIERLLAV